MQPVREWSDCPTGKDHLGRIVAGRKANRRFRAPQASTGSVLVRMGPDAPRVVSLLPFHHLVILPEDRLVAGFEELFAAMPEHALAASQTVLITGPSRTADIELSLVRGVHGPARFTVLVVSV